MRSTARETPGTHNPRISEHTVRRRLREARLRCRGKNFGVFLTDDRRRRRLQRGRNYRDCTINHWSHFFFHGRIQFCLSRGDGRTRVWRHPGERYSDAAVRDRCPGWSEYHDLGGGGGRMSARFRTELIVVPVNREDRDSPP